MFLLFYKFSCQISLCLEYETIVIEIKTERMISAASSTHLEFSTIDNMSVENTDGINTMGIVHTVIASVGIATNLTVIGVFLKHRKLRRKIPNIYIINQVGFISWTVLLGDQSTISPHKRVVNVLNVWG